MRRTGKFMRAGPLRAGVLGAMLALASAGAAAQAVTIYGLLDLGVEHVGNVGGGSLTRMPSNTGALPSRLGFRGSEDLGGGLSAVFTLESGLAPDSGVLGQGGRFFGRQSWVGLKGPWGTVSLGRQYTMLFWGLLDADILGPNVYSSSSLDSYIPNARADNSLAWMGSFGGWTLGAHYSFGRDAVNAGSPAGTNCGGESATDRQACRGHSLLVKYNAADWGAAAAIDRIRGGAGAFGGLTSSALKDERTSLNGWVKLGALKLGAGWLRRENDASARPRTDLAYLGAAYPLTPALVLDGELFRLRTEGSPNAAQLAAVRLTYSFSRRTAVYATAGHIGNSGASALSASAGAPGSAPPAGGSQNGVMVGLRHSF